MKEDYLWDGNGRDPQIEKLENALRAFRYVEKAPPALPDNVVSFPQKPARQTSRLKFAAALLAAAACLAFITVSVALWLRGSNENAPQISFVAPPPIVSEAADEPQIVNPEVLPLKKVESLNQNNVRGVFKSAEVSRAAVQSNRAITVAGARRHAKNPKPEAVRLTKEERYAYDQLMLALSITSSKLKIVKDKVESVEEKAVVRENSR